LKAAPFVETSARRRYYRLDQASIKKFQASGSCVAAAGI
jgi:hypothetical protein